MWIFLYFITLLKLSIAVVDLVDRCSYLLYTILQVFTLYDRQINHSRLYILIGLSFLTTSLDLLFTLVLSS